MIPKIVKFREIENRTVVAGAWGIGNGELVFNTEFLFYKMKKSSGDGM